MLKWCPTAAARQHAIVPEPDDETEKGSDYQGDTNAPVNAGEISLHIMGQLSGRVVPLGGNLLQALRRDPPQIIPS